MFPEINGSTQWTLLQKLLNNLKTVLKNDFIYVFESVNLLHKIKKNKTTEIIIIKLYKAFE